MTAKSLLLSLLACVALTAPAVAQVGHPAKGSWLGYWGPDTQQQRRIVMQMDWKNREISGVLNPGRKAVKIASATLDYSTWTLVLEADMPAEGGKTARWIATGKMENLGSWTNRRYSGTYVHGGETGKFSVTLH